MILVNIESLSISELRSIAEQEGIADSGTLSREELISLLEEIYEEEDEGDGESDPNMRYMSGLTDYRGVSIGEIPGVEELPDSYPDTEIHLIKKNSSWMYAFWSISQMDSDRIQDENGSIVLSVSIENDGRREDYDILILNNWAKDKSRSSRIRLASGAIMIGVTRDDEHITSLVKQDFPLVFVGRREIGNALPVHFVTFDYKPAVEEIVKLVLKHSDKSIVYISSKLSTAEPSADKSFFLHEAAKKLGITIIDINIEKYVTEEALSTVLKTKAVIFDRLFIADQFTEIFKERNIEIGKDIFGAILEDDWTESHEEWTRWNNKRVELGSLAVKHLISSLSGKKITDSYLVEPPVIEAKSTL